MAQTMFLDAVKAGITRQRLIAKGDTILIGVSGGPDSVALLYALVSLKKEFRLTLHIAHLDHMLRKDSAQDAAFVRRLGDKLSIAVSAARVDLKKRKRTGSLEETAREERLNFLCRIARKINADKIALGHNLDDQAETVLMRIIRGTGLYGLAAIQPKRTIGRHTIIRPLLSITRRQIETYLRRGKHKSLRDPTNDEDIFFRNRVRKDLLPHLEKKYAKNIKHLLANLAESAGQDYAYLTAQVARRIKNGQTRLNLRVLSRAHPAMRRLMLREALRNLQGSTRRLTYQHIREIEDLLENRPDRSVVDLPQGISCRKNRAAVVFYRR
ncbi:MAG: tRNA lysidine(34) synthetase TilS [Candidatus Omnitrophica bacterium]|nr:tRNA lysidine(34) synthetase TilS [Candidatus Omnitrophota bacterium]